MTPAMLWGLGIDTCRSTVANILGEEGIVPVVSAFAIDAIKQRSDHSAEGNPPSHSEHSIGPFFLTETHYG